MQYYNQGGYPPPIIPGYPQYPIRKAGSETVSVGEWIGSLLLMLIPVVNLVLMFVWAFSSGEKPSKQNLFRALLILMAILLGISLFFCLIGGIIWLLRVGIW